MMHFDPAPLWHPGLGQISRFLFEEESDAITQEPQLSGVDSATAIEHKLQASVAPVEPLAMTGLVFLPVRFTAAGQQTSAIEKHIRAHLYASALPYAKELAARLVEIARDLQEDPDEPISLSAAAVSSLIDFLEDNPRLARPELAATPSGQLVARWRQRSASVNVFFGTPRNAQYYVATPNKENPEEQDWDSGTTSLKSLTSKLQRHDVLRWMER